MATRPQIESAFSSIPIKVDSVIAKRARVKLSEKVVGREIVRLLEGNALLGKIITARLGLSRFGIQRQRQRLAHFRSGKTVGIDL